MTLSFFQIFSRRTPSVDDRVFRLLLEVEFWRDLTTVMNLYEVPSYDRSEGWKRVYSFFQEKYQADGRCPSESINFASSSQRQEYDMVHHLICHFLAQCDA